VKTGIVIDTGPLVAAFDRSDARSSETIEQFKTIQSPILTCEAVLAETWYLLRNYPPGWEKVENWIESGILQVSFSLATQRERIFVLLRKFRDLPMSLADACLVAMIEQGIGSRVFTFDRHFQIYRHSGRRVVPLLLPS
jgi:predicted nucleic acid-binding protein